jgi:hypothetical protein
MLIMVTGCKTPFQTPKPILFTCTISSYSGFLVFPRKFSTMFLSSGVLVVDMIHGIFKEWIPHEFKTLRVSKTPALGLSWVTGQHLRHMYLKQSPSVSRALPTAVLAPEI